MLAFRKVKEEVKTYLAEHFEIDPHTLYLTHPTFFSRLEAKPAQRSEEHHV